MVDQYSFRANIADQVISLSKLVNINTQDHNLRFMSVQSPQIQNILFIQVAHGGDDDDPIVPPN